MAAVAEAKQWVCGGIKVTIEMDFQKEPRCIWKIIMTNVIHCWKKPFEEILNEGQLQIRG